MIDHSIVKKLLQIEIVADEMPDQFPRATRLGIRSILQPIVQSRTDDLNEQAALLGEKTLKKCRCASWWVLHF